MSQGLSAVSLNGNQSKDREGGINRLILKCSIDEI